MAALAGTFRYSPQQCMLAWTLAQAIGENAGALGRWWLLLPGHFGTVHSSACLHGRLHKRLGSTQAHQEDGGCSCRDISVQSTAVHACMDARTSDWGAHRRTGEMVAALAEPSVLEDVGLAKDLMCHAMSAQITARHA